MVDITELFKPLLTSLITLLVLMIVPIVLGLILRLIKAPNWIIKTISTFAMLIVIYYWITEILLVS